MKILYQDENIIFCVKPAGVLSQSDEKGRANMPAMLSEICGCDIYPIHRLDLEVGGVMVYAKNTNSAAKMSALTASHDEFKKEYLAIVEGEPPQSGVLEDLLYHDKNKNKTYVVKRERRGVKKAKLAYEVMKSQSVGERKLSLVKVRLYTGRTHQIRVQFASRGFPISGDRRYGASPNEKQIRLFSHKIEFVSPFDGECRSFFDVPEKEGDWTKFDIN